MTSEAFGVVALKIGRHVHVRIMTRDAGNPLVSGVIAAAVFKTIGLETHVQNAVSVHRQDVVGRSMAGSAKVIQIAWSKMRGIKDM